MLFGHRSISAEHAPRFLQYVQGLSSESESAQFEAMQGLQKIPDLDSELRDSLNTRDRSKALKVIRTLNRTALTDAVLTISKKKPETDCLLTLRVLYNPQTSEKIAQFCEDQLTAITISTSPGGTLSCLEILAEAKKPLPLKRAEILLNDKSYEVRIATASYAGKMITTGNQEDYLGIISKALTLSPYQLRLEALDVVEKFSSKQTKSIEPSLKACSNDLNSDVQAQCRKLASRFRGNDR